MRLTNGGEIGAFCLSRAIVVAILYVANSMLLSGLYMQVYRAGGAMGSWALSLAIGFVGWIVTLGLFIALRGAIGGTPAMVASSDRNAVTTSGAEIGAYLLAYLGVTVLVGVANPFVILPAYTWLRTSGHINLMFLVSLGISAVSALIFFPVFVGLRSAMSGSSSVAGAYPPQAPPGQY